jgi:hypothetical protein
MYRQDRHAKPPPIEIPAEMLAETKPVAPKPRAPKYAKPVPPKHGLPK